MHEELPATEFQACSPEAGVMIYANKKQPLKVKIPGDEVMGERGCLVVVHCLN